MVIDDAFLEICRRRDEAGDQAEAHLLGAVADLLDHLGRVADTSASAWVRANRTTPLVQAALQVRRQALSTFAGRNADELTLGRLYDLTGLAFDLEDQVGAAMWAWASRQPAESPTEAVNGHG
jgi:hypothetical protein